MGTNEKFCAASGCEVVLSPLDAPMFCPEHNAMNAETTVDLGMLVKCIGCGRSSTMKATLPDLLKEWFLKACARLDADRASIHAAAEQALAVIIHAAAEQALAVIERSGLAADAASDIRALLPASPPATPVEALKVEHVWGQHWMPHSRWGCSVCGHEPCPVNEPYAYAQTRPAAPPVPVEAGAREFIASQRHMTADERAAIGNPADLYIVEAGEGDGHGK